MAHYTELVRELARARGVLGEAWPEARDTYIQHSETTIAALATAVDGGHATDIARLAHLLAGGSGIMGASELLRRCRRLEQAAVEENRASWAALRQDVLDEFTRVRRLLQSPSFGGHT